MGKALIDIKRQKYILHPHFLSHTRCGNFGHSGRFKIESSFFWQLLALATMVLFWPRWCFFWPPCYFSAISMSRSTRCHCITLQICVEAIQLGAMHSKACLRMGCSAVEQCRDWWSIDGVRSGENYTKISLRCCRARGQGDRGGTRSLAGGMN